MDSTVCWKHPLEVLLHVGVIASADFSGAFTFSCCEPPFLPNPMGVLLDSGPVVEKGTEEHVVMFVFEMSAEDAYFSPILMVDA